MERAPPPSTEIGLEKLAQLVGTAVITVTDDLDSGRVEGELRIMIKTVAKLELPVAGRALDNALLRYLPTSINGCGIKWEQGVPHADEYQRWLWTTVADNSSDALVPRGGHRASAQMALALPITVHELGHSTIGYTTVYQIRS